MKANEAGMCERAVRGRWMGRAEEMSKCTFRYNSLTLEGFASYLLTRVIMKAEDWMAMMALKAMSARWGSCTKMWLPMARNW